MKIYDVDKQYLSFYPYYARHGQDKFVNEHIFKNKKRGVFIDIGAYDGVESSNTLFFEESLEWTGVCVEPLPDAFKKLKTNRKNSISLNKCALDHSGKELFMHVNPKVKPCSKTDKNRTSNYEKMSGLVSSYSPYNKKIIDDIIGTYGGNKKLFEVECVHINDILSIINNKSIDLLSIDTEGSEFKILSSINFKKYFIDVIICEVLNDAKTKILTLLNNVGYKKIKEVGYDWVFKKI